MHLDDEYENSYVGFVIIYRPQHSFAWTIIYLLAIHHNWKTCFYIFLFIWWQVYSLNFINKPKNTHDLTDLNRKCLTCSRTDYHFFFLSKASWTTWFFVNIMFNYISNASIILWATLSGKYVKSDLVVMNFILNTRVLKQF